METTRRGFLGGLAALVAGVAVAVAKPARALRARFNRNELPGNENNEDTISIQRFFPPNPTPGQRVELSVPYLDFPAWTVWRYDGETAAWIPESLWRGCDISQPEQAAMNRPPRVR